MHTLLLHDCWGQNSEHLHRQINFSLKTACIVLSVSNKLYLSSKRIYWSIIFSLRTGEAVQKRKGMKNLLHKLGARLKEIRKARRLTQEALAEQVDLTPQYLSRLEGGRQSPSVETIANLAEALHVDLRELFDLDHQGSVKDVRAKLRTLIQESSEEKLRLSLKVLHALSR